MANAAIEPDADRRLLREIIESFSTLPRRLPEEVEAKPLLDCRDAVQVIIREFAAKGKAIVDYGSIAANEQFNYYEQHKARFAETLSRIPIAEPGEKVCEVGSLGVFSILLENVLGYKNIVGMDKLVGKPPVVQVSTSILGRNYSQDILNVDLNVKENRLPEGQFDKLFCFEVLEHLWFPMQTLDLFRRLLKPDGMLFISVPNCISAMSLRKMFAMQVPMVWSAFDDTLEKTHFREYTPLALRYTLAHAGFKELTFDTLYTASSVGDFHPAVQDLYPFPGQPKCNILLQGDTLFSISTPSGIVRDAYPDMLYNTGAYQTSYYSEFPETVSLDYYFSSDWLQRNMPPTETLAQPEGKSPSEVEPCIKSCLKAVLALFPAPVGKCVRSVYRWLCGSGKRYSK